MHDIERSHDTSAEYKIRTWIGNKESICPYAPGSALYRSLPRALGSEREWACYFAKLLREFYSKRERGRLVDRLVLLPPEEWHGHDEARDYAVTMFWRIQAGYFQQKLNGDKQLRAALGRSTQGIQASPIEGIYNPIIGEFPDESLALKSAKSLFMASFSPLYRSERYYRYAPSSVLILVRASALAEKRKKNAQAMRRISKDLLFGNLLEAFGGEEIAQYESVERESDFWEELLYKIYVLSNKDWKENVSPQISDSLPQLSEVFVNRTFQAKLDTLPVFTQILSRCKQSPFVVLKALYPHTGLYATPDYLIA